MELSTRCPPLPCLARAGIEDCSVNTDLMYLLCPLNISFHYQKGFTSNTFKVLMRLEQTSCVNGYSLWSQWFSTVSMIYVRFEAIFMYVKQAVILPILFHLTLRNGLFFYYQVREVVEPPSLEGEPLGHSPGKQLQAWAQVGPSDLQQFLPNSTFLGFWDLSQRSKYYLYTEHTQRIPLSLISGNSTFTVLFKYKPAALQPRSKGSKQWHFLESTYFVQSVFHDFLRLCTASKLRIW